MKLRGQYFLRSQSLLLHHLESPSNSSNRKIIPDRAIRYVTNDKEKTTYSRSNQITSKGSKIYSKFQLSTTSPIADDSSVESMTSVAANYLSSLRIRAAEMLAKSLPPSKREVLLQSINAVDKKVAAENTRKSIGEAIVSASEKEGKRSEQKWKERMKDMEKEMEQAAMERIMNEMKIDLMKTEEQADGKEGHPILGRAIEDLGYKTVYLTSIQILKTIPVWERQRAYRHERAKAMASDKIKYKEIGLPGVITLYEASDGQLSIIDGQHRVGMMAILDDKQLTSSEIGIDLNQILVELFHERNMSTGTKNSNSSKRSPYAKYLFADINKAEPVKLVDMPGVAKLSHRNIIDDAVAHMEQRYSEMFKPSQRCRAPHLNIDNLRDALFTADILNRYSIKNEKHLIEWLMQQNKDLGLKFRNIHDNYDDKIKKQKKNEAKIASKSALEKAVKNDFFLGLESSWLYK